MMAQLPPRRLPWAPLILLTLPLVSMAQTIESLGDSVFPRALPVVEVPMKIDGTTQKAGMVEINGNNLNAAGLNLQAGKSEIRGLIFNRFVGTHGAGIRIGGDGENVIVGNYFGVDKRGNLPEKLIRGILIGRSSSNVIGGLNSNDENIIWASSIGLRIQGEGSMATKSSETALAWERTAMV